MYDYDGCCAQGGEVVTITLLLTVNTVRLGTNIEREHMHWRSNKQLIRSALALVFFRFLIALHYLTPQKVEYTLKATVDLSVRMKIIVSSSSSSSAVHVG